MFRDLTIKSVPAYIKLRWDAKGRERERMRNLARIAYNEKLNAPGGLAKIVDLSRKPDAVGRLGGGKMLVAAPRQYNDAMARIPMGQVTTGDRVRAHPAARAGADVACPLTAGIFTNICAHAGEERDADKIPWWRTLKARGELNEKYPEGQRTPLEAEGHTVVQKGALLAPMSAACLTWTGRRPGGSGPPPMKRNARPLRNGWQASIALRSRLCPGCEQL